MDPIYVPVIAADAVEPGVLTPVEVAGRPHLVTVLDGEYFVFARNCPHENADLSGGIACAVSVICPNHGYEFDLRTGTCLDPVGGPRLTVASAERREDKVFIRIDMPDL